MKTTLLRAGALSCALLATTALTGTAYAQVARQDRFLDANGVDLTHGDFLAAVPEGSIGSGQAQLSLVRDGVWDSGNNSNGHQWDRVTFTQNPSAGGQVTIRIGNRQETFPSGGGSSATTGSTLSGSANAYVYTTSAGTTIAFGDGGHTLTGNDSNLCNGDPTQGACNLVPLLIGEPDGKATYLNWDFWDYCWGEITVDEVPCNAIPRLASVENSYGYAIQFAYSSGGSGGGENPPSSSWHQRTGATFHNTNVSGNPAQGSVSYSYPSTGVISVTDMGGNVWRVSGDQAGISAIRRPGAGSDTTTITGSTQAVSSVTRDGVTTNYSRSVSGSTATMTVTDANSQVTTIVSDLTIGRPTSVTDPLSRTTSYTYDGNRRLTRVTQPEGNYINYTYDSRGNVTETRAVAKSGSGLNDMVTTASYDSTCSNPLTCNQPNSTTDERGFRTDYSYDSTHGGLLEVRQPSATGSGPVGSGVRPETRYSYTLANGVYRLTGISACATNADPKPLPPPSPPPVTCSVASDESRAVIAYDANGNTTSVTRRDGSGTLTATSTLTYDPLGNLLTVDGPLSGTDDTTRYRYNSGRQLIGMIGPDPDGAGSLKHRATRTTYTNGRPTSLEQGNVNSQSDGDWASFSASQRIEQDYDANARPTVQRLMSGSTTYQLTQTSYDGLGRVRCVAQRMNPAEFGSLPSDACTLDTQGSDGPDRISRTSYDNAGQISKVETGYGVSGIAADEVAMTYRSNGQVETVTDANGNLTTYVYDGLDRLSRTRMPHPSTTGTSSTTDYEELTYATATVGGNPVSTPLVASRRTRDASSIGYSYDNLGRLTGKDLPSSPWYNLDRIYTYDNFGRLTSANGNGLFSYSYDALGRLTGEAIYGFGTTAYEYDAAGRRTRMTWPDNGLYVTYDHLVTGEITRIRENNASSGAGVLGIYAYDDLGRRTSLSRGNGTSTSYSYDNVSRLTGLSQNLNGSGSDVTFGYTRNPAGEIVSNTRSNDAYSYTGHANANVANTIDGLNRVTQIGGSSVSHDSNGNVSSVPAAGSLTGGARSFTYNAEGALTTVTGSSTYHEMMPDSVERLYRYYDGSANRWFLYDGQQAIAETNSSATAVARRYVPGPAGDEPLVWYEGSGTSDRRWLHADERGSVIGASDGSGDLIGGTPNRYDEYGVPQGTLTGRFGYTGQMWLSEIGLSHYRARAYNPAMGRFLQTDPIGFSGGMNLYAYVLNNPVNFSDPSGTECTTIELSSWHVWNGATGEYLGTEDGPVHTRHMVCAGGGSGGGPLTYFDGSGNGGGAGGATQCGPASVNIQATLVLSGAVVGVATITGTLTDVGTGRSVSFVGRGPIFGEGAGMVGGGLGHFDVTGTLNGGFNVLSSGFQIRFTNILGFGGAGIRGLGRGAGSLGNISVSSGVLSIPVASAATNFSGVTTTPALNTIC